MVWSQTVLDVGSMPPCPLFYLTPELSLSLIIMKLHAHVLCLLASFHQSCPLWHLWNVPHKNLPSTETLRQKGKYGFLLYLLVKPSSVYPGKVLRQWIEWQPKHTAEEQNQRRRGFWVVGRHAEGERLRRGFTEGRSPWRDWELGNRWGASRSEKRLCPIRRGSKQALGATSDFLLEVDFVWNIS